MHHPFLQPCLSALWISMPPAIPNCLWSQTHPQQQHIECVTKRMLLKQLPQLLGLLPHQERKKKGSGTEELGRNREWACSEVVCLLSSRAQTDWAFTVWPKTLFIQNVLRKELREAWEAKEGECWQAINGCFSVHIVSFISIYAGFSAILKTNQEELEIAYDGFKLYFHFLGWLETVTTAPGIILWNFIVPVSLKERCHKQPQFLDNLDISRGGPYWPLSKAGSWDKNRIW